jgi:hypothetical protein
VRLTATAAIAVVGLSGCGAAGTPPRHVQELVRQAYEQVHARCGEGEVRLEIDGVREVDEVCVLPKELAAAMRSRCPKGGKRTRVGDHVVCSASLNEKIHAIITACPKGDVLVGQAGGGGACMTEKEAAER